MAKYETAFKLNVVKSFLAGVVMVTGTPVGVNIGFKPPQYLKPGDVVRVAIDGICYL